MLLMFKTGTSQMTIKNQSKNTDIRLPTEFMTEDWQAQLRLRTRCATFISECVGYDISKSSCGQTYPPLITPYYLSLCKEFNFSDPVFAQCVPHEAELNQAGELDPLCENQTSPVNHLVHRYTDRALLITTDQCAVRCRHCMRKRLWAENHFVLNDGDLEKVVDYLRANPQVREVILSGGDPLLLSDEILERILQHIFEVSSVEMVRIGTRVPVVLPQRLTDSLCEILSKYGPVWIATHFNHPNEFSEYGSAQILKLIKHGIPVVNQTVLLKGVNDSAQCLATLFTGLLKRRIKPYYLFHGDPIDGTLHFRTGVEKGLEIMDQLRGRVSGLALPHFAIDLPEGGGKIRLVPDCLVGMLDDETGVYRSWDGREIAYHVDENSLH